jgi:hypothetical protein
MTDIVDAYELARNRQKMAASAISSPLDYEGSDVRETAKLARYQTEVATRAQQFQQAAQSCASQVRSGLQCVSTKDLSVPALPDIRPVASCGLTPAETASDEGCKERVRINGQCSCVRCQFISRRIDTRPTTIEKTCTGMPVGVRTLVSYAGTVGVAAGNIDGWYYITTGSKGRIGGGNLPLQFDFSTDDLVQVPPNGEVKATIVLDQCQSNVKTSDLCWIAPKNRNNVIDVKADYLTSRIQERISDIQLR